MLDLLFSKRSGVRSRRALSLQREGSGSALDRQPRPEVHGALVHTYGDGTGADPRELPLDRRRMNKARAPR